MGMWSQQFDVRDKGPTLCRGVLALSWGHCSAGILQQVKSAVTVGFKGKKAEFLKSVDVADYHREIALQESHLLLPLNN